MEIWMVFIRFVWFYWSFCCLGTSGYDYSYSGTTIDQSGNVFVTGHSENTFFGPTIGLENT